MDSLAGNHLNHGYFRKWPWPKSIWLICFWIPGLFRWQKYCNYQWKSQILGRPFASSHNLLLCLPKELVEGLKNRTVFLLLQVEARDENSRVLVFDNLWTFQIHVHSCIFWKIRTRQYSAKHKRTPVFALYMFVHFWV